MVHFVATHQSLITGTKCEVAPGKNVKGSLNLMNAANYVPLTGFSRRTVRSTTDTLGVGTRKAMPVSLLSNRDKGRLNIMLLCFLCNLCTTLLYCNSSITIFFFWHQPVELGDDLADSFGSASGGRDDVLAGTTAVPPQLAGGAVHGLLSGSDGMNRALMDRVSREAVRSGLPIPSSPPSHPAHILMS